MRFNKTIVGTFVALVLTFGLAVGSPHAAFGQTAQTADTVSVAVGPQYDTTHVYVAPEDLIVLSRACLQHLAAQRQDRVSSP